MPSEFGNDGAHLLSGRPTVLIVEDDREIVRGLTIRLLAQGYEVLCAANGEAGLAVATERLPHLVILDIRMPGMDGLTVLRRLRDSAATALTPCIVLSANVAEASQREALSLGAQCFFEKPFDAECLLKAVRNLLEKAPTTTATGGPSHESDWNANTRSFYYKGHGL